MTTSNQTTKNRINREIYPLTTHYYLAIPLDIIFSIVEKHAGMVIQEDGTKWSGILCGENGSGRFAIKNSKLILYLGWYQMPSGNYEITAYVS
jgi:hypothetical protein